MSKSKTIVLMSLKSFILAGICFFILLANPAYAQTAEQEVAEKAKTISQDVVLPGDDLQAVLDGEKICF